MENTDKKLIEIFSSYNKLQSSISLRLQNIFQFFIDDDKFKNYIQDYTFKNELLTLILSEISFYQDEKQDEEIYVIVKNKILVFIATYSFDEIEKQTPYATVIKAAFLFLKNINQRHSLINPTKTLLNDLFQTTFKKIDAFSTMIANKLYTESYVCWRTIHESECIIKLLSCKDEELLSTYVKHIAYNNAYRNPEAFSVEDNDETFDKLKAEMKEHNLKSKDMKKFIEYGWLYKHPSIKNNLEEVKLNFRDGIEKTADLSIYNYIYEGASELVHSSSSFFYVNDKFCKDVSLDMTYRSGIRIFELFHETFKEYFDKEKEETYLFFDNSLKEMLKKILSDFDDSALFEKQYDKNYYRKKEGEN